MYIHVYQHEKIYIYSILRGAVNNHWADKPKKINPTTVFNER